MKLRIGGLEMAFGVHKFDIRIRTARHTAEGQMLHIVEFETKTDYGKTRQISSFDGLERYVFEPNTKNAT